MRAEDGSITAVADIRRPVAIEMEYEVLKNGCVPVPNIHVFNGEGVCVFVAGDSDPEWRGQPRRPGRYLTTAWIPGNFMAEGTFIVGAALSTIQPVIVHAFEPDAVAFEVIDSLDGDSARGDFAGHMPGVIRPMLRWTTTFEPAERTAPDVAVVAR